MAATSKGPFKVMSVLKWTPDQQKTIAAIKGEQGIQGEQGMFGPRI
jgi:hypothetical protein